MNNINNKDASKFLDIKARLFHNKNNGQISIALPKKQLRKIIDFGSPDSIEPIKMPKNIPIRIFNWRKDN